MAASELFDGDIATGAKYAPVARLSPAFCSCVASCAQGAAVAGAFNERTAMVTAELTARDVPSARSVAAAESPAAASLRRPTTGLQPSLELASSTSRTDALEADRKAAIPAVSAALPAVLFSDEALQPSTQIVKVKKPPPGDSGAGGCGGLGGGGGGGGGLGGSGEGGGGEG